MADADLIGEPNRCICNKLLCTCKNDLVIIKCSRCKRYMVLQTRGVESVKTYDLNAAGKDTTFDMLSEIDGCGSAR